MKKSLTVSLLILVLVLMLSPDQSLAQPPTENITLHVQGKKNGENFTITSFGTVAVTHGSSEETFQLSETGFGDWWIPTWRYLPNPNSFINQSWSSQVSGAGEYYGWSSVEHIDNLDNGSLEHIHYLYPPGFGTNTE